LLSQGDRAPQFELPDLGGGVQSLARTLEGGPALVIFWKPECNTCHLAFPYYQRLVQAYPGGGWQLLAVSQEGRSESEAFAQEYGLTFPVLLEGDGWPVSRDYDPDATPTAFLIRADGLIELVSAGFAKDDLNEISRRLAERLGVAPQTVAPADDGNPRLRPG